MKANASINQSEDLNDYQTMGKYACASGSIASSLSNCPVSVAFVMFVLQTPNNNYTIQVLLSIRSPWDLYVRRREIEAWSSWYKASMTVVS